MRSNTTFLKLVILLSLIGIGVSGKLLSIHNRFVTGQASLTESCTVGGEGCNNVAASKYSDVLGVPLASIALGYYVTLLLLSFWAYQNLQGANEPLYTSFFLATGAVVVTVIMFVISNYVLKAFCQYCAMLWLVNLAVWPCLVKQLGLNWGNALSANRTIFGMAPLKLRKDRLAGSFGTGLACVVIFGVIGVVWKGAEAMPEGPSHLVEDYEKAPIVMLSADAYGGPSSKGLASGAPLMEIAELADFQCPGCKMAAQSLKPFVAAHHDEVRLTFHNFPLDGSCNPFAPNGRHPVACALARGSLCAGKQGKFWPYHDEVYDRQNENTGLSTLDDVAQAIGLDVAAFQACLKDPATESALQKDMQIGEMVNLESTPTLIINGRKLVGGRSPADLAALLASLERAKAK